MQDTEYYTLEDNHNYIVVDNVVINDELFLLLVQIDNQRNICIRKIIKENNKDYLSTISEEEYQSAVTLFSEKNKNLFE